VEKMRKLDFLSSMVEGARKEVREKIKKKKEREKRSVIKNDTFNTPHVACYCTQTHFTFPFM